MKLDAGQYTFNIKGILDDNMCDKEFFIFCQHNRDIKIERDHTKEIFIKPPTVFSIGVINATISGELYFWNKQLKSGTAFGSSTGFTLHDGAVFSPNLAWVSNEKLSLLAEEDKKKFAHVCPNFVVELKSPSDRINTLKNKMLKWIENGA